ncbi:MAG: OmpA family protein [Planctomycetes bacterium]|nr:OmpA family protein [Planctomycetota bacterium]
MRPLVLGLAAVAAISLSGCGNADRELGYKDVEIDEYKRQISELEEQLYKKNAGEVKVAMDGKKTTTGNIQNAVGGDFDVSERPVEVVMSIESEVLFKAGSATLSGQAKASLNKAVAVIKERFPNHDVKVVGHTDDQKISRSKGTWNDNWDLSAGRAREVLLYLESRGIPAKQLGLAGYGDQRPVVPNANAESRQKNRRVEIVVVPTAK